MYLNVLFGTEESSLIRNERSDIVIRLNYALVHKLVSKMK